MKRILIALLISLGGIGLSWYFLSPREAGLSDGKKREAIAEVLELRNDVNRQTEGRLLWSPIRKGDQIFLGDKIKTSGLSSTTIQFKETDSKLEIEENSMVVMSQVGKKLELNMLEGRVFIQQEESSGNQLDLMSGGKKLDLKGNAAISVSKDGQSQVESFANQQSLFTDLKPNYSEEILSVSNDLTLSWKASDRNEMVQVFVGESPLLLKKNEDASQAFSQGNISVKMKPGVNYWQLVTSVNGSEVKSPLMKLSLLRPQAPATLFPGEKETVRLSDRPFDFKWIKGNTGDDVLVEVSKDPNFSQMVISETIKNQTFFTPPTNLKEGEYFWRVKSKVGKNDWIESKVTPFKVYSGSGLLSPSPLYPQDNAIFYIKRGEGTPVTFEWRKQDNVRGYELKISGESFNRETQLTENSVVVNMNRLGKYNWTVLSEGRDGSKSSLPTTRKFEVRETGRILWKMGQKNFLYLENLPVIILRWEKNQNLTSVLEIAETPSMTGAESFKLAGNDFPYRVLKDGIYFAKVRGIDENGVLAAESEIFEFKVEEAPLPPAPILKGSVKKIQATPQGNLGVEVTNAKPTWLTIASLLDINGRVVDERRFSEPKLEFSGLLPGKYNLQLRFQDEYRRAGELGERVEVVVPEKSMIMAPKLKGIKVR